MVNGSFGPDPSLMFLNALLFIVVLVAGVTLLVSIVFWVWKMNQKIHSRLSRKRLPTTSR